MTDYDRDGRWLDDAQPRTKTAGTPRVVLTDQARLEIRRELSEWDGREQGGALAGRYDGSTIVVEHAGGLGVGVKAERGNSWVRLSATRMHDFAVSHRAELVGDWHSHPDDRRPSKQDEIVWERLRSAIGVPAYVGMIVAPRRATAFGLTPWQDDETWAWSGETLAVYVATEDGCRAVPPPR